MSIGLSRNARLLLAQLVEVHQRGKHEGRSGDQLAFTLSVDSNRTTAAFASGDRPLETNEIYAVEMLRANGLIEEFTTIKRAAGARRYIVTQAAVALANRSIATSDPDTTMRRRADGGTATVDRADARRWATPATEAATAERTKRSS
jgi:hypothetical protein